MRSPADRASATARVSESGGGAARALAWLTRAIGLDTRADRYAYAVDPVMGYTAARKIPERWVKTTCGYCSVGCGMFIGVKEGRAVAVRGDSAHPVNAGTLCPKGLSEHETLHGPNRARYPLLRRNRRHVRVSWDEAIQTIDRKSTRLNSSHIQKSRMPSSA